MPYLDTIDQVVLLSAKQERHCAQQIERGRAANEQLVKHRFTESERQQLLKVIDEAGSARSLLVLANLRLVAAIARRHCPNYLSIYDLIQEGNIGLLQAVERFDWRYGCRFSTYAAWWIRQSVFTALNAQIEMVRLPAPVRNEIRRVSSAEQTLRAKLCRQPSDKEIAALINIEDDRVRSLRMFRARRSALSLQQPLDDGTGRNLEDLIAQADVMAPEELSEQEENGAAIRKALAALDGRDQQILRLRYGLVDGQARTYEEIAGIFRVTSERVRMLERKLLLQLRQSRALRKLMDDST